MSDHHVIVIGAGAGGLAAAVDLAAQGMRVTVLEAAAAPGGKMHQVRSGEHLIDAGPTVLTMRWVFDDLFARAGENFNDWLPVKPITTLARHWWTDGSFLDLHADPRVTAADIAGFAGSADAEGYLRLCRDSAAIFDLLKDSFMAAPKPNPISLVHRVGWHRVRELLQLRPTQTLWQALGDYLGDARLRQLFGRYATYVGSSPLQAPATLMLITHAEQNGVWVLPGGMTALARGLQGLAEKHGATFRMNTQVREIHCQGGRVSGVTLADGEQLAADRIVFNGDRQALASGRLGPGVIRAVPPTKPEQRGLSAVTWCLRSDTAGFPLTYHNVFFGKDYPDDFAALFGRGDITAEPTVYVCAQDRLGSERPEGPERMLLLVNAPALGDEQHWDRPRLASITQRAESVLRACGLKLSLDTATCRIAHPGEFAARFPGSGGSLYGQATHGLLSSFERPAARTRIGGLYLAGGSAHPGPGVPMATLSGQLAARAVTEDVSRGYIRPPLLGQLLPKLR